ncbi:hypothetical protein [Mariniplasma anaerobium]|uniref:L-2-amino-thiazoline-4-carboxylic acid hydrolase n=1 Tax=Mariniplasma anaerobium TaxID=2735436 RepID=A0A7U9TGM3_9MOLU|nr:hypothetical protein [Mariniplasma anaerobium]BCR35747.1 hypothetical protein MPAN_006400 [Mariniplasma anaerobium]
MDDFEKMWREKILKHIDQYVNKKTGQKVSQIEIDSPIEYSKTLISTLKKETVDEQIQKLFIDNACHIPHHKLDEAKKVYSDTQSLSKTREALELSFLKDIIIDKNLSKKQAKMIIENGWGLAGIQQDDTIIATKIPSKFHQYMNETDPLKKKYFYCHCPRVRENLLNGADLDSIYCNCGGGFYVDIWTYITGKDVSIKTSKSLFDGDDVCQFVISFN